MEKNKYAQNLEQASDVLARTLYGEARGEKVRGLEAVASVIINRVEKAISRGGYWWGSDVESVCLKKWQFSCWNVNDPNRVKLMKVTRSNKVFATCKRVAQRALAGCLNDLTNGATHYHVKGLRPAWSRNQVPCAEIGNHLFYKGIP
jgi:N-acetylmuramoyl-L-alanine amidase